MKSIRVLMADDHPVFRAGMRSLLEIPDDIVVVGEANDGEEALKLAAELQPDILLLDIEMPGLNGVEVVHHLNREPAAPRILVLSAFDDEAYISNLLAKGVSGYLTKAEAGDVIVDAVRQVAQGEEGWLSRSIRAKVMALHRQRESSPERLLSGRELDVLRLLAAGQSNKEIAAELNISSSTVKNHISNIYPKLGVHTRVEAVLEVQRHGLDKYAGSS